jgi:hypothetical protein
MANNKYGEKYTRELLTDAVANSISIAGVLRYLEIPIAGGTHAHISRKIKQLGIDTSHFKRVAPNKGKPSAWRLAPEHVLVVRSPGSGRPKPHVLRRVLRESGVLYACQVCGIKAEWERQADSIVCGPYQRRLARQQEGESSLSLSELPLADSDIRW